MNQENLALNLPAFMALGAYFIAMLGIGYYAYRTSTSDMSEYMLGGRNLHPAVGALSAGASDMSGWMLMGLPGAIYVAGLSEAWIAVGLVIGAYLNYKFVAPRLRVFTELADDSITIPEYFGNRFKDNSQILRMVSAIIIVIFFTLYTSSGVVAGGKLFESSFGLDYQLGLFLTAGVVIAYTLIGGFLAVSLTDFVQGCIMFIALITVPIVTIDVLGGWDATAARVTDVAPGVLPWLDGQSTADGNLNLMSWLKGTTWLGLVSSLAWGLGYFGQPHIIVRFMAIRSLKDIKYARWIGMTWMIITVVGAVFVGVAGLAYGIEKGAILSEVDSETVFIVLSQILFHPFVGGLLLAAILAAIMSTISSQLLVASSSLAEDFYKTFLRKEASQKELVMIGRGSVLLVSIIAIVLAFDRSNSILDLVSNAWAGLGSAFGPIVLLSLWWKGMTRDGALAGMIVGAITVLFWLYAPIQIHGESLSSFLYEIIPGFSLSLLAVILVSKYGRKVKGPVEDKFVEMVGAMTEKS